MDNQMEATQVYQICIHSCRLLTAVPQHEPCSSWSVESRVFTCVKKGFNSEAKESEEPLIPEYSRPVK